MKKTIFLLGCVLMAAFAGPATANEKDYLPLKPGFKWVYQIESWRGGEKEVGTHVIHIFSERFDPNTKTNRYFDKNSEILFSKSGEGVFSYTGVKVLKFPVKAGSSWVSSGSNRDFRHFKVERAGVNVKVRGKTYHGCIVRSFATGKITSMRRGEIVHFAIEDKSYLCRGVGLVLSETYEVSKELGERRLVERMGLVEFERSAAIAEGGPRLETSSSEVKGIEAAFRYPEKGFTMPALSPDNKWVVYLKREDVSDLANDRMEVWAARVDGGEDMRLELPSTKEVTRILWSSDGSRVAVGGDGIWSKEGSYIVEFGPDGPGKVRTIQCVGVSWLAQGQRVACAESGSGGLSIDIYDASSGSKVDTIHRAKDMINYSGLAARPAGNLLAFNDSMEGIYVWDVSRKGREKLVTKIPVSERQQYYGLMWAASGGRLLFYRGKGLYALDVKTKTKRLFEASVSISSARWSPDGKRIAFIKKDRPKEVKVYDFDGNSKRSLGYIFDSDFNWSPDGNHIAFRDKSLNKKGSMYRKGIFLVDAGTGEGERQVSGISGSNIYFSKDGKFLVWSSFMAQTFFIVDLFE